MVELLQAADNPHICSGKSLVSGLRAVALPSSGRTHLAVQLTVGDPAASPASGLKLASSTGNLPGNPHVYLEIRAAYQKSISHPERCEGDSRLICN
jgi:hypothetical protein